MPRFAPALLTLAMAATLVHADETGSTALDSLVAAEKAFSALSVEQGMKPAFLGNLADDGIIFRPGPVNGRDVWEARRNPPGVLIWEPSYAEVSALGDLGVSTGPWESRPPADVKGEVAHGHFVSIWERGEKGPWKVAVDFGIVHPRPATGGLGAVEFRPGPTHVMPKGEHRRFGMSVGGAVFHGGMGLGVGMGRTLSPMDDQYRRLAHEVNRMMGAERTLTFDLRGKGAGRAYPKIAAEDVRMYREGALPTVGITPAIAANEAQPQAIEFQPYGKGMSGSCDLGYSYGLALRKLKGAARPDTSSYLHVWRRNPNDDWKLSLDVESPFPKR